MNCLYCNKPITDSATEHEKAQCWHTKCVKKFFGTTKFPLIDISNENLIEIANESTNKGITVPGVQKKLSLRFEGGNKPRLTLSNYPTGYILKPQTEDYEAMPEAEYLVMNMAKVTGIRTVPFALVKLDGGYAYITKRIDRSDGNMLAMEDFCQLEERLTQDKYKGSYERCAKLIGKYSERRGFDLSEMFLRLVFSFVTGNSDMHLKNFSLIEDSAGSQRYVLSEAYDLLPVNAILPEDIEQFALTMNGKKRNIRRKDFFAFADNADIPAAAAEKIISDVVSFEDAYVSMCRDSYLPDKLKATLTDLIIDRINIWRR